MVFEVKTSAAELLFSLEYPFPSLAPCERLIFRFVVYIYVVYSTLVSLYRNAIDRVILLKSIKIYGKILIALKEETLFRCPDLKVETLIMLSQERRKHEVMGLHM